MAIVRNCQTISRQNLINPKNSTFDPYPDERILGYTIELKAFAKPVARDIVGR